MISLGEDIASPEFNVEFPEKFQMHVSQLFSGNYLVSEYLIVLLCCSSASFDYACANRGGFVL